MKSVFEMKFKGTAGQYLKEFWGIEKKSVAAVVPCSFCDSKGFYPMADSPDDFINTECSACNGTGKIISTTI